MAWIVGDSFDYYAIRDDVARSVWDSATVANFNLIAGAVPITRFGVGQMLRSAIVGLYVTKTMASNESVIYACLAYYRTGALSGTNPELYIQYRDGAAAQCSVVFESSGNLVLKGGIHTGPVLATYTGAFAQDVWTHFQIRVVISNTVGSMTVRKNGATSDSYASATTLDTAGGTANDYANVIALSGATPGAMSNVDDLCFFSGTGAAPNTWTGDVRAICLSPMADTAQKNFAVAPTTTLTTGPGTESSQVNYNGSTVLHFTAFTPTRSGVLSKIQLYSMANYTLSVQMALYAGDAASNMPGTLLATTAVLVNPVTGYNDLLVASAPTLVAGRSYWLATIDSQAAFKQWHSANGAAYYSQTRSYALGFPNPAGAVSVGVGNGPFGLCTVSGNVAFVSEPLANGDTDFVYSATVNDADLYEMDDLPYIPQSIVGVVSKVYIKKSDAGARSGQLLVKSGATQVGGTDTILGTTYTYFSRPDMVDPATAAPWTVGGVNALQVGQKVTA